MDVSALPFNKRLGLGVRFLDDRSVIVLDPSGDHLNHVGTVHATVIFGVAEAASGHFLLARFPHLVDSSVAVLRTTSTKYRRPGSPEGEICARGSLPGKSADRFLDKLTSRGRASVDIEVTVVQNDNELFTGTFGWFVARDQP